MTVAARVRPDLTWRQGDVTALPFPADSFDVVLSQMALMFIGDRAAAVRELVRVTAPGGRVGVLVPSELARQAMFTRFIEVAELSGTPARQQFRSSPPISPAVTWTSSAACSNTPVSA